MKKKELNSILLKFTETQVAQLKSFYIESIWYTIPCFVSYGITPFKIVYFPKSEYFVVFAISQSTSSLPLDESEFNGLSFHRLASIHISELDSISPFDILLNEKVYSNSHNNTIFISPNTRICDQYHKIREVYSTGYTLENYLTAVSKKGLFYGFRISLTKQYWHYIISTSETNNYTYNISIRSTSWLNSFKLYDAFTHTTESIEETYKNILLLIYNKINDNKEDDNRNELAILHNLIRKNSIDDLLLDL